MPPLRTGFHQLDDTAGQRRRREEGGFERLAAREARLHTVIVVLTVQGRTAVGAGRITMEAQGGATLGLAEQRQRPGGGRLVMGYGGCGRRWLHMGIVGVGSWTQPFIGVGALSGLDPPGSGQVYRPGKNDVL